MFIALAKLCIWPRPGASKFLLIQRVLIIRSSLGAAFLIAVAKLYPNVAQLAPAGSIVEPEP